MVRLTCAQFLSFGKLTPAGLLFSALEGFLLKMALALALSFPAASNLEDLCFFLAGVSGAPCAV